MANHDMVISYLNRYLAVELTGHKQYLLSAQRCGHWGFTRLSAIQHNYSIEETQHAAKIIQRILFLKGVPRVQDAREIIDSDSVQSQLQADHSLVSDAIVLLREAVLECEKDNDFVSRELFQFMLDDEEQHLYWLEKELSLIQKIGLNNYQQSQL